MVVATAEGYRQRRVLVTGATGFVGRNLAAALLSLGARVRVMVRTPTALCPLLSEAEVVVADLEEHASLAAAVAGQDLIFHAAGFAHAGTDKDSEERHWRVNAEGSRQLIVAARAAAVSRFVLFSSVKVMGGVPGYCIDEDWPVEPDTPYGRAKRVAEQSLLTDCRESMEGVVLRPVLVYGPGGRGNLTRMIRLMRQGLLPPLPEVGNRRSLVHVADLAQAALLAGSAPQAAGQRYIVTDGHPYSGREIQSLISQALGRPLPSWSVPEELLWALARTGDLMGRCSGRSPNAFSQRLERLLGWACFSNDRIVRELGFSPRYSLSQALPAILAADGAAGGRWR